MKLYHWDEIMTLKNYAPGDLIVMAVNEVTAREIGREALTAKAREEWDHFFNEDGTFEDDDYAELWAKKLELIETDMRKTPKVVESGAVCIRGSD